MPSVIAMISSMPASSASRIESAAKRGGTKIIAVLAPGLRDRLVEGVEHRDPLDVLAALARSHAADDLGAVVAVAQRVERALAPGDAGHAQLGVLVDQDAHPRCRQLDHLRRRAVHRRLGVHVGEIRLGQQLAAPRRRWSRRAGRRTAPSGLIWSNASISPLATSSQRVMPPKMLNSTALTLGSDRITSTALVIASAFEPPPGVEEVGGLAAGLGDDVERRHHQPGAVAEDADVAVELHVGQARAPWPSAPADPRQMGRGARRCRGWRNSALPSSVTLASSAFTLALGA